MAVDPKTLKPRTKLLSIRIIQICQNLEYSRCHNILITQLLRCGTSVGANYRAACRARSTADFIAKLKLVEEECDEILYWIELLAESGLVEKHLLKDVYKEANEILAMIVASLKTSRAKNLQP